MTHYLRVSQKTPREWSPGEPKTKEDPALLDFEHRLNQGLENAEQAFWAEIVRAFPEVTSGDMDPISVIKMNLFNEDLVLIWLFNNHTNEKLMKKVRDRIKARFPDWVKEEWVKVARPEGGAPTV